MKKIILLFTFLLCSALGFSQLETFEGGIPSTWAVMNGTNGTGAVQPWILNTTHWPLPTSARSPYAAHNDPDLIFNAAYVNNEQIGMGNTEEDWLIMNQRTIPANGQLQFWTRLTTVGDQGTIYEIRVSTNASQTNQAAYTVVQTWGEDEMIDPTLPLTEYQQVKVDFPAALQGQNVYIAFVRKFTQLGTARDGDRWLIDDVNIVEKCPDVTGLDVIPVTIASYGATLSWTNTQLSTNFELAVIPAAATFNNTGTPITVNPTNPANYVYSDPNNIVPGGTYKFYVRRICGSGTDTSYSEWAGPFIFTTLPLGSVCSDPLQIDALPYQVLNGNTAPFGDEVDTPQGGGCGAVPANTNYLQGNEVFYSYTATENGLINVVMTPLGTTSTNSSVFVYNGCPVGGACVAGAASANTSVRNFTFTAIAGTTYTIVISSSTTQTIAYGLLIQKQDCAPMPTGLNVDNIIYTPPSPPDPEVYSAHLFWDAQGYTSWEVAVQPLGSVVPAGSGVAVSSPEYTAILQQATQYQYWVRAECTTGTGIWSAWAGPFPFNSLVCPPANTCNYTFRIANTTAGGWGTTRMQVRQNGIVVATLGTQLTTGTGPVDVFVPICEGIPFDLFWSVLGTNTQQRLVTIINNHGQTIYTRPTGPGTANTVLYTDLVPECDTPRCDIAPTNVTISNITTTTGTIHWDAASTKSWDILIVPQGTAAPTVDTVPTYDNIEVPDFTLTPPPFTTTTPLLPDHCYDVYVRVNCSPNPSAWSNLTTASTFCTLPTCFKPVNAVATTPTGAAGTTSTTFTWALDPAADQSATQFEILLIPGPNPPSPLPDNGTAATYPIITVPVGGPYTFTATDLLPATIYYAYVRTVCSPTDSSVWTPFNVFNTVTCADADKCNYRFVLTNTPGNSWNNGRMQVRQNGILIATLGATAINNPAGVTVPLCNGVPFDLFWSVPGNQPAQMGVTIINPFLDVLFTKAPGEGTPGTVVYASTGNCVPAACSKPTNIVVQSVTATSATVTWTDISIPTAPNFAIYIVPTIGGTPPINDPATPPTIGPIPASSLPFTISAATGYALNPSTSYTFYVKSLCSDTESSTWTILSPTTFITTPLNNLCSNATPVTVNTAQTCNPVNTVHGNTYGANSSIDDPAGGTAATGCGTTDDDIWFSFVASATSHTINFSNIVGTPAAAKINHSVFSGACGAMTQLYCSTSTTSSTATGLVPGQTYYVRVYTSGTNLAQYVNFDMCITSPPANDECVNAATVQVNPLWECNPTLNTAGSTLGASPSTPAVTGAGCGGTDDDIWFSFTATNNIHIININDIVGSSAAVVLNHSLFSGPCDNLVKLYCSTAAESVATGLIPNQVYYIRVYTAGTTAGQSATFNVCVSTPPPPATNDECANAINVTPNLTSKCTLTTPGNLIGATGSTGAPNSCLGGKDDDVWFTFTAVSPQQIISLLNVEGTTTNLNHAVYQGSCGSLTLKYCSTAGDLTSTATNFVVGQTYYIRVWSNATTSQVVVFDLCVKSVSTCDNAEPFCGASLEDPYIYENTSGIPNNTQIACLGSIPNPTYYYLHISSSGDLVFNILQNTQFDAAGNPVGTNLDVDFVAWGPFDSQESCDDIVFDDCPTCPNNTTNGNFYPFGNIVDCSYDASFTETLTINNAIAGQYYVILVTNFNGAAGFIRLVQTNFDPADPDVGTTVCCDVDLGDDIAVCATSVELNALEGIEDLDNVPGTYLWYFNGSTTPIPNATGSTLTVTQSGTYTVKGSCGVNPVEDEIVVVLGPVIETTTPEDYTRCIDDPNFDLNTLTPQVLTGLNPADYIVTYYLNEGDANLDALNTLDTSVAFNTTVNTTIYIRVESAALATCYSVVPVNLVVTPLQLATFDYSPNAYCKGDNETAFAQITGVAGTFTAVPNTLAINAATGDVNVDASPAGVYTVTNTIAPDGGCTPLPVSVQITINDPVSASFNYGANSTYCSDFGTVMPTFTGNGVAGSFTSTTGLVLNGSTGEIDLGQSDPGTYVVQNQVNGSGVCPSDTQTASITITGSRSGTIAYNEPFCKSSTFEEVIRTAPDGGTFSAEPGGLSFDATSGSVNPSASTAGSYIVKYTIPASGGCDIFEATAPVNIIPESMIDFIAGCEGNDFVLSAVPFNSSFDPLTVSYSWSGGNFVAGPDNTSIILKSGGTYTVTITTVDGCIASEPISIDDISCIIQRGISPNNDTKNDSFDLTTLNVKHLSIFNRYGTVVYEFTNYTNQWIGQDNSGDELPDGTYFYVIDKADGEQKTGWIYINR